MTACIYHGPPGSYKTFSIIQDVILPALVSGRVIVTNIRGFDDIGHIESVMGFDIPDSAEIIMLPHTSAGFKSMAQFFHWAPEGALIVMDEGQRVYPSRLRNLSCFDNPDPTPEDEEGRPNTVEDAFDKHRHFNWDIYISTPYIGKINNEVRQVCEYAYKHRDLSGFLPWWKNRYRQAKHEPLNNGTSASHHIGDPKRRKADVRVFGTYKSTQTGTAKGSNENKSIFQQKRIFVYLAIVIIGLGFFIKSTSEIMARGDSPASTLVSSQAVSTGPVPTGGRTMFSPDEVSPDRANNVAAQQLFALDGHYKGSIYRKVEEGSDTEPSIHLFSFIDPISDQKIDVTSRDLVALGIDMYVSDCLAYLTLNGRVKLVTCVNPNPSERSNLVPVERSNASERASKSKRYTYIDHTSSRTLSPPRNRLTSADASRVGYTPNTSF